jgi:hypothetical protein
MDPVTTVHSIVQAANGDASVLRMLHGWDRKVALIIGSTTVGVVFNAGTAAVVQLAPEDANISFRLSEDTLELLATRRLTPLMGKMKGLIHSSGNTVDRLRFASILTASIRAAAPK